MDSSLKKLVRTILLSNDDGVDSNGLKVLYDIATQLSDDVWIVAPSKNRSGASRSITLRRDVVVEQLGPKRYVCSGTPSDCIIFGMTQILEHQPDLVLTGINHGMNVADDILYSGTVAGAMEAAILGVPSIALSQCFDSSEVPNFTASKHFGVAAVRYLLDMGIPDRVVINVNFPKTAIDKIKGMRPSYLDRHKLGDVIIANDQPNHYQLGPLKSKPDKAAGSDRAVLDDGWISFTPLIMDLTAYGTLAELVPVKLKVESV